MNPNDAPSPPPADPVESSPRRAFALAAICTIAGLLVGGPGFVYATSDMSRRMASGRRYATYDPELLLFGIDITPSTAQWLAFGVAPVLFVLAALLLLRGIATRKRPVTDQSPVS